MNTVLLNTISLDDGRIIKKGGSGGGGNTPGGGGGSDMPVIGDGKTYLYITIAEKGRMDVPLFFSQSVSNGVTIDWGDGSEKETYVGSGSIRALHKYADKGDYVISLDVVDGCTLFFGSDSSTACVMGAVSGVGRAYCNMLKKVEIGRGVTTLGNYAFQYCRSLSAIVIPKGITKIPIKTFYYCFSLSSIEIPDSVVYIGDSAFEYCQSLSSIEIPDSVTSLGQSVCSNCKALSSVVDRANVKYINYYMFSNCESLSKIMVQSKVNNVGDGAFSYCSAIAIFDFSQCTVVPTLGSYVFSSIASDAKIIVPDALYDEWKNATNWSSYANYIVKASEFTE